MASLEQSPKLTEQAGLFLADDIPSPAASQWQIRLAHFNGYFICSAGQIVVYYVDNFL